ncbi:MAG TPA: tRNA pseudouridine(38-40) synthase TruA [Bryobacteraceae bacterium]|nr:tRNA pseudouridine(38-40) synthase TruA [Bryobacteraceae bacterium]
MERPPRRIRATISYDGTDFHGWQVQPGLPTIQGELQTALSELEGSAVHVAGSGRTDAGVHAIGQTAAFTLTNPIPVDNLRRAVNHVLPPAIRVMEMAETEAHFHPRYHASAKTYEYRIWRGEICSPFDQRYLHHHPYPLFLPAMKQLAPLLEGRHDFSAFAASEDKDERGFSKIRTIFSSEVREEDNQLLYRVRGNGFLKHMVRNIMGALLESGKGNLDEAGLRAMLRPGFLDEPGARKAGPRAPACGLFLISVDYPRILLNPPPRPEHAGPMGQDGTED